MNLIEQAIVRKYGSITNYMSTGPGISRIYLFRVINGFANPTMKVIQLLSKTLDLTETEIMNEISNRYRDRRSGD